MKKPPFRTWIGLMILWTTAINYCFRTFFPVTLIAMLDRNKTIKQDDGNVTIVVPPDYGTRYPWTPFQEGQLIGAYFYGYTIGSLPGGPIAEYIGPYMSIILSSCICCVFTLISAHVIVDTWITLFVFRLIVGMAGGLQYPALQCLIGRWAPPNEKGKFVACLMGNVLGSVITQSVVGVLVSSFGWTWGFYFAVIMTLLYLVVWVLVVSDYPDTNRFCSADEANHIFESHAGSVSTGKSKPPLVKMFSSIPFITLIICQFGNLWGLYLILTVIPKYMAEVLKFNLKNVGFLSATPSLSRFIFGFIFGGVADFLLRKEIVRKVFIRKGFILFSHILPGVVLFLYLAIGDNVPLAVTFLIIVMAFNGAAVVTCIVNAQDLAPNFAGTQFGIMNFFGSMTGFIIPTMVAEITKEKSEIREWAIIFGISGTIYICTGVLFIFFGSVNLQPWNEKTNIPRVEAT